MSLNKPDSSVVIKGRMVSLTVLELFTTDLDELDSELMEQVARAPKFFRNAPVILDFEQLDQDVEGGWLDKAFGVLVSNNFIPVGITGAGESLEYAARARNIAVWPAKKADPQDTAVEPLESPQEPAQEPSEPPQPEPKEEAVEVPQPSGRDTEDTINHAETLVVKQPVRSGQKVYAQGGDLLVLASVSTGAEVLADGHIHVYGTLRGRALAGVQGNTGARVFCNDLQADLVSIAGYYMINEDLPADMRGRAVQVYLQGDELKIEPLR